jgi:hypothetical protein
MLSVFRQSNVNRQYHKRSTKQLIIKHDCMVPSNNGSVSPCKQLNNNYIIAPDRKINSKYLTCSISDHN